MYFSHIFDSRDRFDYTIQLICRVYFKVSLIYHNALGRLGDIGCYTYTFSIMPQF